MKNLALVMVLAVAASACGKGYGKLTEEQKQQFGETLSSMGRTKDAVQKSNSSRGGEVLVASVSNQDQAQQMAQILKNPGCKVVVPQQQDSRDRKNFSTEVLVTNSDTGKCGVAMDLKFSVSTEGSDRDMDMKASIDWTYSVSDEQYRKLNDIDQMSISGPINMSMKTSEDSVEMKASADVKGKLHSQKNGDLSFQIKGDASGKASRDGAEADGETVLTIEYPDYTAALREVQKADGNKVKSEYYLNDEKITDKEYKDFIAKSGLPFGNSSSNQGEGISTRTLSLN